MCCFASYVQVTTGKTNSYSEMNNNTLVLFGKIMKICIMKCFVAKAMFTNTDSELIIIEEVKNINRA